jgi:hypothetical protein
MTAVKNRSPSKKDDSGAALRTFNEAGAARSTLEDKGEPWQEINAKKSTTAKRVVRVGAIS